MLRTLVDEGYAGGSRSLHYALTEADVAYRAELRGAGRRAPERAARARLTEQPAAATSTGFFGPEHLEAVAPWHAARPRRSSAGRAGLMGPSATHYATVGVERPPAHRAVRPARSPLDGERDRRQLRFAASGPSSTTPARPCSSRPRPPGSTPSSAAAWASASPAPRSRPPACTPQHRHRRADTRPRHRDPALRQPSPVGDVAVDL